MFSDARIALFIALRISQDSYPVCLNNYADRALNLTHHKLVLLIVLGLTTEFRSGNAVALLCKPIEPFSVIIVVQQVTNSDFSSSLEP